MKFTTHLNIVPRLRMSGAVPLLHGVDRESFTFHYCVCVSEFGMLERKVGVPDHTIR